jgi:predicted component of type VI protein secretion system
MIPLQRPVLLIGRHPECDVQIDLGKVSRRHCCVALVYNRVMIRDLGSRNGLRVNGLQVEEAQLYPGDEVAIGPIIYRMEEEAPAPSPPAPAPIPPAASVKPPSLPNLPDPNDPDGELIPLDL